MSTTVLPGCDQVALTVVSAAWVPFVQQSATAPRPARMRWSYEVNLHCELEPLRYVELFQTDDHLWFRRRRRRPSTDIEAVVSVSPDERPGRVSIGIGRTGLVFDLPDLRNSLSDVQLAKPPREVRPLIEPGEVLTTGTVIDVADSAEHGWTARLAIVTASDTFKDRTRWRLRGEAPEHHPHALLWTSGRRSGYVQHPAQPDQSETAPGSAADNLRTA